MCEESIIDLNTLREHLGPELEQEFERHTVDTRSMEEAKASMEKELLLRALSLNCNTLYNRMERYNGQIKKG